MRKIYFLYIAQLTLLAYVTNAQVSPVLSNGKYSFSFHNVYFEVSPSNGGRVSSFKVAGAEMLYLNQANANNNSGGTFWTAPQTVCNWPPLDTLDSKPYSASVNGNSLTLKSAHQTKLV